MREMYPIRKAMGHAPPFGVCADDAWYFITICAEERGGSPFTDHAAAILDAARYYHRIGKWFVALFMVMPDHLHAIIHFPPAAESNPTGRAVVSTERSELCEAKWLQWCPLTAESNPIGRAVVSTERSELCEAKWLQWCPLTAAIDSTTNDALDCDCGGEGTRRPTMPTHEQRRPVGMMKTIADWKHFLTRTAGLAFQRDFFDTRIRDDAHYGEKWRYIVRNPVTRGLVATPREWSHVIAFNRDTGEELPHR